MLLMLSVLLRGEGGWNYMALKELKPLLLMFLKKPIHSRGDPLLIHTLGLQVILASGPLRISNSPYLYAQTTYLEE